MEANNSTGTEQAEVILQLLEFYEITSDIFSVCCDTTNSNTGAYSGAVVILAEVLDKPLLWFMCRRHILEVHISHFMEALTGEKTKGPRRGIYTQLQKCWPSVNKEANKLKNV